MRDLTLVDSLLAFVERLERQEEDPEQLEVLFQIDHLATRMRRNGENLLILAGHGGQNKHAEPVMLLDVVRAAMSEVSEYTRVRSQELPQDVAISPEAADDLSHLVAELLDNATAYSSANLPVSVRGRMSEDGALLLEVIDDGIGIPQDRLDQLNQWLATPPQLSEDVIRHMGLYVVSRLAARQGVNVQLQTRPFSGTTAYVHVPATLVTTTSAVPRPVRPPAEVSPLPPIGQRGPRPSLPSTTQKGPNGLPRRESKRNRRAAADTRPPKPQRDRPEPSTAPTANSGELWELPQRRRTADPPRHRGDEAEETVPVHGRHPQKAAPEPYAGQPPGFAERIRADLDGLLSGQSEAAQEIAARSEGNRTSGAERAMEK
ncbi:hypothetical protein NI17_019780 [Thermobifida halotolerans]|uniref:histidine kinase n=1 Tax=Thermobifida halotolerans TaxID=483545 RepID=A0AA97LW45_9ACTN|nr:sensor histidine kinase [Thermobifida halotolerans]UOE18981.1 hypothetical protein NI17_019780 [Thermobifida halotolerans]